jgi:UDP-N-acetylmuramoylalanine--D-glutamate ligase
MILLPYAKNKIYGVCGLGKSGRATVEALLASGAEVWAWDDNEKVNAAMEKDFPAAHVTPMSTWPWAALAALMMSPGIPLYHPQTHPAVAKAMEHKVELLGDVELLFRAQPRATFIGITGTNGKSTTTALIGHILERCGREVAIGGNLGIPALALEPLSEGGIYVLELSSYQLELLQAAKMHVAILLNISPDHLDHHGGMENYIAAKKHIFDRQGKKDVAVVGIDDAISEAICRELAAGRRQGVIPVSARQRVGNGIYASKGILHNQFALAEQQGDLRAIKSLQGEHNWQNAAASYAACFAVGCAHDKIMAAMQTYPGLPHRMQWLGEIGGIQLVNDSKATNADAAEKSLRTYDYIYWIAGGIAKEGGIAPLEKYFPKIRRAYLIGEAATEFEKTLKGKVAVTQCGTLDKAFAAALKDARKDKVKGAAILLAPACASFDQFANFEARGEAFMKLAEAARKENA